MALWTQNETNVLCTLVSEGFTWKQIASELDRSHHSVQERWRTINRDEFRRREKLRRDKSTRRIAPASKLSRASAKLLALLKEHHDFNLQVPPGIVLRKDTLPVEDKKPLDHWFAIDSEPMMSTIIAAVCQHFQISRIELRSRRRDVKTSHARQVAFTICKHLTSHSLPEIGRMFGGKDHTTVLHGVRRIEKMCREDLVFAHEFAHLEASI